MAKPRDDILCQRCGKLMAEFLDGEGDSLEHQKMRQRVATIPTCRECFESYKKTTELCRKALSSAVPAAFGDRLATFLRRECTHKH